MSLFLCLERLKSAAAIVARLSRPASQKSGAWSKDDDPEAGKKSKEEKTKDCLEVILEEEFGEDNEEQEPMPKGAV